jgi:choline-sulfatase
MVLACCALLLPSCSDGDAAPVSPGSARELSAEEETAARTSPEQAAERTAPPAVGRGANLLLVTIDTLSAERVGCYGYDRAQTPRIDGLAQEGLLFERALTVAPLTLPSHTSLLTGLYPLHHGVRDNGIFRAGDSLETLAEALGAEGYATGAFVSAHVLEGFYGLAQGFDTYDDSFGASMAGPNLERPADRTTERALAWLGTAAADKPWFAWVHLFDPHVPYLPPARFPARATGDASARYDAEVTFADEQLGRLLDSLEASGQAERTLVVVTSDHGESFGQHDEPTHGFFVYDAVMRVPLVMRFPPLGQGRRVSGQVSLVDIFPTVLEILLGDAPGELDGRSLLSSWEQDAAPLHHDAYLESQHPFYALGLAPIAALSTADYKYIEAPRPELYAHGDDPGELQNLFADETALAAGLAREMLALRGGRPALDPEATDALQPTSASDEDLAKLRALGYTFGAGQGRDAGIDPKDIVREYNELRAQAAPLFQRGRFAELVPIYERILAICPGDVPTMGKLGEAYHRLGDYERAEAMLRPCVSLRGDQTRAALNLAHVLRKTDRREEALEVYQAALKGAPTDTVVLIDAAQIALELGRNGLALEFGRRALEVGALSPDKAARVRSTVEALRDAGVTESDG